MRTNTAKHRKALAKLPDFYSASITRRSHKIARMARHVGCSANASLGLVALCLDIASHPARRHVTMRGELIVHTLK